MLPGGCKRAAGTAADPAAAMQASAIPEVCHHALAEPISPGRCRTHTLGGAVDPTRSSGGGPLKLTPKIGIAHV